MDLRAAGLGETPSLTNRGKEGYSGVKSGEEDQVQKKAKGGGEGGPGTALCRANYFLRGSSAFISLHAAVCIAGGGGEIMGRRKIRSKGSKEERFR